ncbi:MAG: hypothetical protein AMXMBFR84_14090 [Candidatus Hydrogenedentota bacterium]
MPVPNCRRAFPYTLTHCTPTPFVIVLPILNSTRRGYTLLGDSEDVTCDVGPVRSAVPHAPGFSGAASKLATHPL